MILQSLVKDPIDRRKTKQLFCLCRKIATHADQTAGYPSSLQVRLTEKL
jgi:hypothetical protein